MINDQSSKIKKNQTPTCQNTRFTGVDCRETKSDLSFYSDVRLFSRVTQSRVYAKAEAAAPALFGKSRNLSKGKRSRVHVQSIREY